jgi:dolichyl-phosphate beta-glucosyltransferase
MGNVGNLYIQLVAVPGIWDTQNGFKAFRDYAAEKIFKTVKINRWAFDVEALFIARKLNYKIGIIPIHWINDPKSHVKMMSYFKVLWDVLKIRRTKYEQ